MAKIESLDLLERIGKFEAVSAGTQLPFSKLTVLFAENGRGKTTLAAIFRSLTSGDATHIQERKRLTATNQPHVVVRTDAGLREFQNGAWSSTLPDIYIFDDAFVTENVYAGMEVGSDQRQNLHELILGAQGIALNAAVQGHIERIEVHNREIRRLEAEIPSVDRGPFTADEFCAIQEVPDITAVIADTTRALSAAKSSEQVKKEPDFSPLVLPSFDTTSLNTLLACTLDDLDAKAVEQVQQHFSKIGSGGESWVGDGMSRVVNTNASTCPFCDQDLGASPLIGHYRAYFSAAYAQLKKDIENDIRNITRDHGGDVPAAFERAVRQMEQRQQFWKDFATVPQTIIDTAEVARSWKAAREGVLADLQNKRSAPLEKSSLSDVTIEAIKTYNEIRDRVEQVSTTFVTTNPEIAVVKEKAASADVNAITKDLQRQTAIAARYRADIVLKCKAYLDEKAEKSKTETARDQAREALEQYRSSVFPAYENAINVYLQRFGAGFRLSSVESVNSRGGSSCTYRVVIDNIPVALTGSVGEAAFKNTLSAGDRNTLALAFFFVSLERDPQIANKIIVIDDPMTSLDEGRSLTTVQEIYRLSGSVSQMIVLSHSQGFLSTLWDKAVRTRMDRSAIKVVRDGDGSTIATWDVQQDSLMEHDRRYAKVAAYITSSTTVNNREAAEALRPMLEQYCRVSYAPDFPPGTLLGNFLTKCRPLVGTPAEILGAADVSELQNLLDYGNKFHHDTNPARATEIINDAELHNFCTRTMAFITRP